MAGSPAYIQLRHIAYPTLVISFRFLTHLSKQPFYICLAYRWQKRIILCLSIQQSAGSEESHLCVVRYYSLTIAVIFFQPPLMGIESCNTISAIPTLDITEGIDKLHRISQCITNGSAYKRASYSVFYYILVHLTLHNFCFFIITLYDCQDRKVTIVDLSTEHL